MNWKIPTKVCTHVPSDVWASTSMDEELLGQFSLISSNFSPYVAACGLYTHLPGSKRALHDINYRDAWSLVITIFPLYPLSLDGIVLTDPALPDLRVAES